MSCTWLWWRTFSTEFLPVEPPGLYQGFVSASPDSWQLLAGVHIYDKNGLLVVQRVGASDKAKPVEEDPYLAEPVAVSPFKAFLSATQALAIAAVLFFFATTLDTAMSTAELPDQYTVRSIAVTLRTIVTGLAYLATFIFAANGVGLAALTVQLAIYGDEEVKPKEEAPQTQESMSNKPNIPNSIPNVGLTSHPEDVMRAFDEVSDLSRYRKDKTQA